MAVKTGVLEALSAFKDWSNYLLVTTVAAAGWVGSDKVTFEHGALRNPTLWCFGVSIVFGIFTLAIVPLLEQQLEDRDESIYNRRVKFSLFAAPLTVYLTMACRPQHIAFIAGIILFCAGMTKDATWGVIVAVCAFFLAFASRPAKDKPHK